MFNKDTVAHKKLSYQCAHCQLSIYGEPSVTVIIEEKELKMCCPSCVYAAEMLVDLHYSALHPKTP